MSNELIAQIISYITLAIQAAPTAKLLAEEGRKLITALFNNGLITVDVQNQLHIHIDAIQSAALAGQVPPSWTVEPDPQ